MSSWRKCVFGCDDSNTLFNLPKEETTREAWLDFVYGDPKQKHYTKNLFICDRHFEDDCLVNKAMFQSGLSNRLMLRPGSVPTIYVQFQPLPMLPTPKRKCNLGCEQFNTLFSLPKEEPTREQWRHFVFCGDKRHRNYYNKAILVCDNHFEDDCFLNKPMFQTGLCSRLHIRHGSVPTIRFEYEPSTSMELEDEVEEKPSISSFNLTQHIGQTLYSPVLPTDMPSLSTFPVMLIPGKTESKSKRESKSVGTQLSYNTLRNPVRSKAAQAAATFTTSNVGVQTIKRRKTLPLAKAFLAEPVGRPKKRPRVEMEEEKEEEDVPIFNSTHGSNVINFSEPTDIDSTPDYEDTKYIVFEKNLLQLFEQCPVCSCACTVQRQRHGTFVSLTQNCPECMYSRTWQNQPLTRSTPVGDLQLSAAVYFTGGSFQKMQRICRSINLQIHHLDTFKKHSRMFLEPAICHNWKLHQKTVFDDLREQRQLPVAGEMRARPPGPSAKMGSYTTMDMETKKILDVQLVQRKENVDKNLMEKRGLKRCLDRLEENDLKVDYVITDRHAKVQKYLENRQIAHYFDVWRLEKELSKRLDELSEKKDFLIVKKWSPAIKHHMYWSAASSQCGEEKVAKWISHVNHIQDIHKHDDPLFPHCAHPDRVTRDPNKWFKPGTRPLYEVEKLLLNSRVLRDVPKLCSSHQTSSLDVFHKVSLQFAPDDVNFSFMETKCRLFLAAMHFNENTAREEEMCGESFLLPKSEQACPAVKTRTTFGYVRDLMKLLFTEVLNDPAAFVEELKKKTVNKDPENDGETIEPQTEFVL
ncbi:hypothetical protein WMY93_013066 [Mugilogobius chulae]|uniref:THAP-type domain-containing protein n=1 Tax=Mugilogobius chulae TaxID=88201 RepID=A0AAW0P872_9GOBI